MIATLLALFTSSPGCSRQTLERELREQLKNVPIGSQLFHKRLATVLGRLGAYAEWQPSVGPSPIRIALLNHQRTFQTSSLAFWPTESGTAVQDIEDLADDDSDVQNPGVTVTAEAYRDGNRLIRVGSARAYGNWSWPIARTYRLKSGRWEQTCERTLDEYATDPPAHFLRRHGVPDPNTIIVPTTVYPPHLSQPHSGPLLLYHELWSVRGDTILREERWQVPTALGELDRIAGLVQSGNQAAFNQSVPRAYRSLLWNLLKEEIGVFCPHYREYSECPSLSLRHGGKDGGEAGITLNFEEHNGKWRFKRVSRYKPKPE